MEADGPLVILGLTPKNIEHLQKGQPIMVDVAALIQDRSASGTRVVLHYGETQKAIIDELAVLGIKIPYDPTFED